MIVKILEFKAEDRDTIEEVINSTIKKYTLRWSNVIVVEDRILVFLYLNEGTK